jgi:hypothetical protein
VGARLRVGFCQRSSIKHPRIGLAAVRLTKSNVEMSMERLKAFCEQER